MAPVVRVARATDLPALGDLIEEWSRAAGAPAEPGFAARCEAALREQGQDFVAVVAVVAEESGARPARTVGFASGTRVPSLPWGSTDTRPWLYVNGLFVTPDARGHGVGRALLEALAGEAAARGCRLLRVTADDAARAVYAAAGFRAQPRAMVRRLD